MSISVATTPADRTPSQTRVGRRPQQWSAGGGSCRYVVAFDRAAEKYDALTVLDADPSSSRYGQIYDQIESGKIALVNCGHA